jgi:hypothetical protein
MLKVLLFALMVVEPAVELLPEQVVALQYQVLLVEVVYLLQDQEVRVAVLVEEPVQEQPEQPEFLKDKYCSGRFYCLVDYCQFQ